MRGLFIGVLLGLFGLVAIGTATSSTRHPEVNETHTLIALTDLGAIAPIGSTVRVECQLPRDAGYLAVGPASGITILVVTVTADQLDSTPRGPFTESCAHWQQRHHVLT